VYIIIIIIINMNLVFVKNEVRGTYTTRRVIENINYEE